jgi:hypothetical protein
MAFEQKDMTGAVFNNRKKEKETHPDRTGDCTIDGKKYWISGWVKQDRDGKQFLSLSFKPKDAAIPVAKTDGKTVTARNSAADDFADEVPF